MTREEVIDKLEYLVEIGDFPRCEDALKMAIEALKQEPCEDAISRKAVIDSIMADGKRTGIYHRYTSNISMLNAVEDIKDLPPVQPKREHGMWKDCGEREPWYRCSECKERVWGSHYKFCPHCGAYMREAESEDKDD